jgi:hypothetical protein
MKKIIILIALVLFTLTGITSYSQNPPLTPPISSVNPSKTKPKQAKSNNHQRGSDALPLVVKVIPSNEAKPKESTDAQKTNKDTPSDWWDSLSDWLQIIFNGLLAIFTLGLLISTYKMWQSTKKSADAAEKAAKAAEISAQAIIRMELPVIRAFPDELLSTSKLVIDMEHFDGAWGNSGGLPHKFSAVRIDMFINNGRTPALPERIDCGWSITKQLPPDPNYTVSHITSHSCIIKPGDEFHPRDFICGIEFTDEEIRKIADKSAWFWFYGCLHYRDFINKSREFRFCWRYAERYRDKYRFASDGNPPASYTRNT